MATPPQSPRAAPTPTGRGAALLRNLAPVGVAAGLFGAFALGIPGAPASSGWAPALRQGEPFVEVVIGALLLVQFQRQFVAWCAVVVLVSFTALLAVRLAQGERPPCACFGSWSAQPIGARTIVRNFAFIAMAVAAALL